MNEQEVSNLKIIYNLKYFEQVELKRGEYSANVLVMRVPNGWLIDGVFVPYDETLLHLLLNYGDTEDENN